MPSGSPWLQLELELHSFVEFREIPTGCEAFCGLRYEHQLLLTIYSVRVGNTSPAFCRRETWLWLVRNLIVPYWIHRFTCSARNCSYAKGISIVVFQRDKIHHVDVGVNWEFVSFLTWRYEQAVEHCTKRALQSRADTRQSKESPRDTATTLTNSAMIMSAFTRQRFQLKLPKNWMR